MLDSIGWWCRFAVFHSEQHIVFQREPAFQGKSLTAFMFALTANLGGELVEYVPHLFLNGFSLIDILRKIRHFRLFVRHDVLKFFFKYIDTQSTYTPYERVVYALFSDAYYI